MMMTPYPFELHGQKIIDFDTDEYENFLALTEQNIVFTPFTQLKIPQSFKYPLIRRINASSFLIASCRSASTADNAFIYNDQGEVICAFYLGDAVEDILIHSNKIVVSYFDEGVFGRDGPNNEGLCVFNLEGQKIFGYNSNYQDEMIADCYAICHYKHQSILFYPYPEFQLYELNLDTLQYQKITTPKTLAGAYCISSTQHTFVFHSPYAHKTHFFEWYRNDNRITPLMMDNRRFKALRNGYFYTFDQTGYEIIHPSSAINGS